MIRRSDFYWLIKLRGTTFRNHFLRPTPQSWARWSVMAILGTLFIWGDYVFFHRIIRYLDGLPFRAGEELVPQLLNVVFLTLFAMVLFSSVLVSLSLLYLSADLDFLHAMPLGLGPLLTVRFIQCVIFSSWMMLLFSLPIYVAYGRFFHLGWDYYAYLSLCLVPFVTLPCALGGLATMVLMKFFPARRVHQVLSLVGLVFLVGLVVYLRFLSPEKFFGKQVSDEMIMAFVQGLKAPDYPFLPSSWMTLGITRWAAGERAGPFLQLFWLFLSLGLGAWAFIGTGKRIYFSGWRMVQEAKAAPPGRNSGWGRQESILDYLPLAPSSRALLAKDVRIFLRDPEQWSQLFILCALVIVYIFNIMNLPLDNTILKNVVSVLNIGLVGFVLAALISRFVFPSVSVEGQMFWTIYTAPVDMENFLWSKFWLFFPPLLAIAELLVVVSNYLLQVDSYVMNVSVLGVFLVTFGLVGLGLGTGAMYPQFEHENISEISSSYGGILYMISSLMFIGLVLVLGAWPLYVHFNERFLFRSIGGIDVPMCYVLIVVLALLVAFLPLKRGIRALKQMDI